LQIPPTRWCGGKHSDGGGGNVGSFGGGGRSGTGG
jgi:hypothetical protein